ncbi:hypothetical protein HAX54_052014 [Datura stramonium]|uniref:C2 domain-containing protein n=1 Tax=Datura stramonium TaxID=4076 RepID=A0ABS8WQB6_DATST|nr:hypothetical protein [Datura stramonium]
MPHGQLEVFIGHARGLEDQNWLTDMNPYVVVTCRTEEKKSSTASGEGENPEWNETFLFTVTRGCDEVHIKIMDENTFKDDDFIGETTLSLEEVFDKGEIETNMYELYKDDESCGSINIGLTFTDRDEYEENY